MIKNYSDQDEKMKHQSLLNNIKADIEFKMFINIDGEYYNVTLVNETMTINDAIIESVHKFNN